MFKKLAISAALSLAFIPAAVIASEEGEQHVEDFHFSFEGPFGVFDQNQLQRGLQIYTEVCSACHGLKYVPLRTLSDEGGLGIPADQVRAYAAENFEVYDAELDEDRPATPVDHFPANDNAGAPDLSLMAKARAGFHGPYGTGVNQLVKGMGGPEYIMSILTGYTGHEKEESGSILYENTAFPGGWMQAPASVDTTELAEKLRADGVLIEPGVSFFAGPDRPRNFYRLGYSSIPVRRIEAGIERVAKAMLAD